MTQEALRLALEALITINNSIYVNSEQEANGVYKTNDAITAIKEALAQPQPWEKFCDSNCVLTDHHPDCKLAQPQQEPVGEARQMSELVEDFTHCIWDARVIPVGTKLYTTPSQRNPLSGKEIDLLINGRGREDDDDYVEPTGDGFGLTDADLVRLVRRVEAAHNIKE